MNTYNIGPLTMRYVFQRAGIENVFDMQVVFDAVEDGIRQAQLEAEARGIDWAQRDD